MTAPDNQVTQQKELITIITIFCQELQKKECNFYLCSYYCVKIRG
jgi:hypothetical protein